MVYSLAIGIQKLKMPLVTVKLNDFNLTFLIDTGATHNTIASFVYEQMGEAFVELKETYKVMGIEGEYQDVIMVKATLEIEKTKITTNFSVVDMSDAVLQLQEETGLQLHGLLGIPFLVENNCVIDFQKQEFVMPEEKNNFIN